MLFILNRQEKVVGMLKNSGKNSVPFFNDLLTEDLATGSETFEFTTVSKNGIGQHLVVGNFIAFKKGQSYKLFQIMQTEEDHQDELYISVYAECAGLQLINSAFRGAKIISASFDRVIETLLSDTSWNVGALPYGLATTYDLDIEQASVYSLLQTYAQEYGVELEFRVEINHGKISKKYVDGYYSRGKVTGKRFTYERDIEGIVRKTDATELYTALIGKGNNSISFKDVTVDGIDKPMGQDFVANQSAYEKYNNNGYHIVGIYECDTDDAKDLLRKTHKRLLEVSEPKVEYDVSVLLLCELLGEKWNEVAIGDTISVFDNAFYPPIMVSARVSKLQTSMTDKNANKCTLANFIEVKSNITAEMRKIASQLQGYVDNRFPIGSNDIQDGAVGTDQINDIYTQTITTDILKAGKVETEKLIAEEAEIINAKIENLKAGTIEADKIITDSITAVEGKFDKISADLINADKIITDSITAVEGKFDEVTADLIEADKIIAGSIEAVEGKFDEVTAGLVEADKVIADTVKANKGEFDVLEAKVGQIDTLVSGNISSENIQTGGITGDNLNMETIFVRDANILDLSASKLTAGEINTSQIIIASEDGGMRLVGSTQQFIDENNRIRIQLGKDAKGDFDFYILAENGDILFNTRGITGNAIENGLIKENMVSDGAIGGKKINWQSFTTEFNKDSNTHKLNSSKVLLDGTNQTLDVHFNSLKSTVNDNVSKTESNTTQLNVHQGKINTLIQDTTITKDGQNVKLKDEYSKLEQTVGGLKSTVGEQQTTINQNTGKITAAESKVSTLEQTVNGFNSELSHVKTTIDEQEEAINSVNSALSGKANSSDVYKKTETMTTSAINSAIKQSADSINLGVSNTYETKSNVETKISSANTTTLNSAKSYADTKKQEAINSASTDATNKVNSAKNELNTAINKKANSVDVYTKTETYTKSETDSKINIAKDSIELGVSQNYETKTNVETKVNNAINNMQIGGRTLLRNGLLKNISFPYSGEYNWRTASINDGNGLTRTKVEITDCNAFLKTINGIKVVNTNSNNLNGDIAQDNVKMEHGETYTMSAYFKLTKGSADGALQYGTNPYPAKNFTLTNEWKKYSFTFTYDKNRFENKLTTNIYFCIRGANFEGYICGFKLEKGTKATDYIEAIEDVDSAINSKANSTDVYSKSEVYTKAQTDSAINVAKDNITLSVSQNYETKSNVTNKINTAKTEAVNTSKSYADTKKQEAINSASTDATNKVNSAKNELNTAINKKANSSDVYTKSQVYTKEETNSQIKVAKDEINLGVSNTYETKTNVETKVNNAINNMQIGGTNIIKGTNTITQLGNSGTWANGTWRGASGGTGTREVVTISNSPNPNIKKGVKITTTSSTTGNTDIAQDSVPVTNGSTYTLSCYARKLNGNAELRLQYGKSPYPAISIKITSSAWTKFSYTFTIGKVSDGSTGGSTNIYFGLKSGFVGSAELCGFKLETGNKATDWTPAPEDIDANFNEVYDHVSDVQQSVINSYESALEITKKNIALSVSEMYAKKDDVSSVEQMLTSKIDQTAKDISFTFNKSTDEVKNDLQGFRDEITSYIRFDANGMELGKQGSKFKTRLSNEKLAFLQGEDEVAYISNNKMNITDAEIKNQLTLGSYAFVPRSNGNLSLKWIK